MKPPVGIAGLGLMGGAFAQRFVAAGFAVFGYDVDGTRSARLPDVTAVDAPSALARHSTTVVISVFDTDQVETLLEGADGLAPAGAALDVICTSTCDPDRIAALVDRSRARGINFLEVPISGTSRQVAQGGGVGLVGGDADLHARLTPILDVMCARHLHVGGAGSGSRAKLSVNLVLGLHRAALAEGLVFGDAVGLDPRRLLEVLQLSAAASSVMPVKGPAMVERVYDDPQSRVDQSLKDFALIHAQGRKHGRALPLADLYTRLLESNVAHGEAALDSAVIVEAIRRRSDLEGFDPA